MHILHSEITVGKVTYPKLQLSFPHFTEKNINKSYKEKKKMCEKVGFVYLQESTFYKVADRGSER
jgi:hypothetical protein